jgi:hypothetical protein
VNCPFNFFVDTIQRCTPDAYKKIVNVPSVPRFPGSKEASTGAPASNGPYVAGPSLLKPEREQNRVVVFLRQRKRWQVSSYWHYARTVKLGGLS